MSIAALVVALAAGVVMGMFGAGGSILVVPMLVHVAAVDPRTATTASLVVVGVTSLITCALDFGRVRIKIAAAFALAGIPGAYVGSLVSQRLEPTTLMLLFASAMIMMALTMLRQRRFDASQEPSVSKIIPVAFGIGILTGTVGVGGGLLIVPSLLVFGGVTMADAIGTSLVIITINCVSGLVARSPDLFAVPWGITLLFTLASVVGSLLGLAIAKRMSVMGLRRAFAVFVLGLGLFELAMNLPV